jgi:hypothetical protein
MADAPSGDNAKPAITVTANKRLGFIRNSPSKTGTELITATLWRHTDTVTPIS